jgi:phosphate starvation-inducible membrane PsiE
LHCLALKLIICKEFKINYKFVIIFITLQFCQISIRKYMSSDYHASMSYAASVAKDEQEWFSFVFSRTTF